MRRGRCQGGAVTGTSLFLAVLFGSLGFGYLYYGRSQRAAVPAVCGLLLVIVPFFLLARPLPMLAIGAVLAAIPFFVRR